ncbi:lipoate--protein ligase family protein [bacterium]|nr:MAG: lipoate--protein ligase family protein [bacterium]
MTSIMWSWSRMARYTGHNQRVEIADGRTNMAKDAELLFAAEAGAAGWRVYRWDGPWVSLGRFQRAERAVVAGWERWCVRPTGGRAVLHGHDLTLAYALPHDGDCRQIKEVYRRLIAPLVEALNACGLECQLAETTRYVGRGRESEDCFAFRSPNDVVCPDTGKKVCGCALRISERGALLQASVPHGAPLVEPGEAIVGATRMSPSRWDADGFLGAVSAAMSSRGL